MINSNYMRSFILVLAVMAGFSAFGQQGRRVVVPTTDTLTDGVQKCSETIFQTAHGFSKSEAIYHNGTTFVSMLNLYGDNQVPHYIVVDSINANMFIGAACGIYDDTLGLSPGEYFWTDGGPDLSPDTVEYPILKIYNGKAQVMGLPGFEFDATNKPLIDVAGLVGGQRTFLGGQVIPLLLDSIAYVDTICGLPVTTVYEALQAYKTCTVEPDSLVKSDNAAGTGTSGYTGFFNSLGRLTGDADYFWDNTNNALRITKDGLGVTFSANSGLLLRTTSTATGVLSQMPPSIISSFSGWNGTSAVPLTGSLSWTPVTSNIVAGATFRVGFGIHTLLGLRFGDGISTHAITVGPGHTTPATGSSYGLFGFDNTAVSGAASSFGIGRNVTVGANRTIAIGSTVSAIHNDAVMVGGTLFSSAANTAVLGFGLSTTSTTNSGVGLQHYGEIPQLRTQGLLTLSSNNWTSSGAVVTLTNPIATLEVGQGVVLVGASTSFRTITAVSSTTVFTVNSAPTVSSGTQIRAQLVDILQVGDGTLNYNSHMVINRSGLVGLGITAPTSRLHLPAGTTLVAPMGFTAGTNLTTPVAGKMEWDGTNLFMTQTSGPTRRTIAYTSDIVATNLTLTGTSQVIELTNSNGTDVVYKGVDIGLTKVSGTKDTLYLTKIEHWGEVLVSGGTTSVTTGTPERPDNDTPGTPTANLSSEYTTSGSTITYIGASGQAEITGNVSFQPTTGGDYILSIFKEGVEIGATKVAVSVDAGKYETVSLPKVNVTVSTNDTFDVRIEPTSGTDTITVYRYTVYSRKIY